MILAGDLEAGSREIAFNNDPFDAVIVATARLRGLPLLTKDEQIVDSNLVEAAW